jgi:hypothetical protein
VIHISHFQTLSNSRFNRTCRRVFNSARPVFCVPKARPKKTNQIAKALIRTVTVTESIPVKMITFWHLAERRASAPRPRRDSQSANDNEWEKASKQGFCIHLVSTSPRPDQMYCTPVQNPVRCCVFQQDRADAITLTHPLNFAQRPHQR